MVDSKRMPEVRFQKFGNEWDNQKLGDIGEPYTGLTGKSKGDFGHGKGRYVTYMGVFSNPILSGKFYESIEIDVKQNQVKVGDALFTTSSEVPEEVGMSSVCIQYEEHTYLNSFCFGYRPCPNTFDSYFFAYMLRSHSFRKKITFLAQGISRFNISKTKTMELPVALPINEEQTKIGELFKNLDTLINQHQTRVAQLANIKKSMLDKMFPKAGADVPRIRFNGFTNAWKRKVIAELGEVVTGSTPSTNNSSYYANDGIPWVTPTDILHNITLQTAKHLSIEGQKVARVVPENTILITCIASIGKNTILGRAGSFNQQINGLIPYAKDNNPYFLFINSILWSSVMKKIAASGTMQIVNKSEFSSQKTCIPDYLEQTKIGQFFQNLDTLIAQNQKALDQLKNLKQALLNKMFV
jgi:type I restriction enzyme S subunit